MRAIERIKSTEFLAVDEIDRLWIEEAKRFATHKHEGQTRKYSNEPYTVHLQGVADIVSEVVTDGRVIAAAWLHDVLEDTNTTLEELTNEFGSYVALLVYWVTDVSRPQDGNRAARKKLDIEHLSLGPEESQTIKLADLIHNSSSIVDNDPDFARVYLKEKGQTLKVLTKGDPTLYKRACDLLIENQTKLDKELLQEKLRRMETR